MGMEGGGWEGRRKETSTVSPVKITKSLLFKYAVITENADWCSWICMCFDSADILGTVTVSLLANYHGKLMGQVTAGSLKETGDWTYAEDVARWQSPENLWHFTRYMTWLFVLCKLGVSAGRSCHVLLLWTSTPALYCVFRFPLWGIVCIHNRRMGKALSQNGLG